MYKLAVEIAVINIAWEPPINNEPHWDITWEADYDIAWEPPRNDEPDWD